MFCNQEILRTQIIRNSAKLCYITTVIFTVHKVCVFVFIRGPDATADQKASRTKFRISKQPNFHLHVVKRTVMLGAILPFQ